MNAYLGNYFRTRTQNCPSKNSWSKLLICHIIHKILLIDWPLHCSPQPYQSGYYLVGIRGLLGKLDDKYPPQFWLTSIH